MWLKRCAGCGVGVRTDKKKGRPEGRPKTQESGFNPSRQGFDELIIAEFKRIASTVERIFAFRPFSPSIATVHRELGDNGTTDPS